VLNEKLDARLLELIKQWNIAEGRIKQAENVRAQEIVSAAIYELRYAGRKVVDAISLAQTTEWESDDAAEGRIRAFIEDAIEDCVKAKHDAIDAALSFVTRWFFDQERQIGLKLVQQFYPHYLEITAKIADMTGGRSTLRFHEWRRVLGPFVTTVFTQYLQISPEARLNYAKRVADYIIFLAHNTGLVPPERCAAAAARLRRYAAVDDLLADI